ncbi:MAG: tail fiber domain-containing protein [Saprospiraceae bacterium]|nr:tail fiber domain-containing protein [Saprospiraceae bacterium]
MNTKHLILLMSVILLPLTIMAQAPQLLNFQAVARNAAGEVLNDKSISVRLSISDSTPNGQVVYQETHTVLTNKLGMFSLRIGGGTVQSGSMNSIDWGGGTKYLRTEIDPNAGSAYVDLGATPLVSVPYALYAAQGGTPYTGGNGIQISGTTITNTGDLNGADDVTQSTLFGGDVTGTYNNLQLKQSSVGILEIADQSISGIKILQMGANPGEVLKWNGSTWAPGTDLMGNGGSNYTAGTGLAINGTVISALNDNVLWNALKLYGRDISSATPNAGQVLKWTGTTWAPLDDETGNGGNNYSAGLGINITGNVIAAQANDAIWNANRLQGFNIAAASPSNGQALVYNQAASRWEAQTLTGGGGVGGSGTPGYLPKWDGTNTLTNSPIYETSGNVGIGITSPLARLHIGGGQIDQPQLMVQAANNQSNEQPLILARKADGAVLFGIHSDDAKNLFIGLEAGKSNQFINTLSGEQNIFIGRSSGKSNTSGLDNTAVGYESLLANISGASNTVVGTFGLTNNTTGDHNTAIGPYSLQFNTTGRFNTALGSGTLSLNTEGNYNTAVGGLSLNACSLGEDNIAVGHRSMFNSYNGFRNIAIGKDAMYNSNTGDHNIAIGTGSLSKNNGRSYQIAIGDSSLYHNSQGFGDPSQSQANTAIGSKSMYENTLGSHNTAMGFKSLYGNVEGDHNVSIGAFTLYSNGIGNENTAVGYQAMYHNYSGVQNTGIGKEALINNTLGNRNSGVGYRALSDNNEGMDNAAMGYQSLDSNQDGDGNSAFGASALGSVVSGSYNTGIGSNALLFGTVFSGNTAVGYNAGGDYVNGNNNTYIGYEAKSNLSNYSNSSALGSGVVITGSNQVRIGNGQVTSIGGFANWTNISDRRVKKDIEENVQGLDFILKLRPVTYHLDLDAAARIQGVSESEPSDHSGKEDIRYTGFIAQEVELAAQQSQYDFSGVDKPQHAQDLYGIRYAEFVAPLVKAVQEQQKLIETQGEMIRLLQAEVEALKEK